jgi:hypothetical protein
MAQPGEIDVSEEVLDQEQPGLKNIFLDQPQQASQTVPSMDKRKAEQLRINALIRERNWFREQMEVYGRTVGNAVRAQLWRDVVEYARQAQMFSDVFGPVMSTELDDSTLQTRTKYFNQLSEAEGAPPEWMEKWRKYAQML